VKLSGTNVFITGANTGIGRVTAEDLARRGARVFLAGRSESRTRPVVDAIRAAEGQAEYLPLDLGDLDSVRACARAFLARNTPIHVLINNAGLAGPGGLTPQGFELTFGTNHLGHYLLTRLLLPSIEAAGEARIVTVSSRAHKRATGIDWDAVRKPTASITGMHEYQVSKLANNLMSRELSRRVPPAVHTYALHPGVVASDIYRKVPWGVRHLMMLFMITNEQGARTTIHCATSDEVRDHTGRYYANCREARPSQLAENDSLARELWQKSAEWVGLPEQ
jgi:NAD(P)-dependent dehydrogenase (short-subunit alcohol dehydrogenase family)